MSVRHTKFRKPPVFDGTIFEEKVPDENYQAQHRLNEDNIHQDHPGKQKWLGCRTCRENLGVSDLLGRFPSGPRRDRNWNYPSL